MHNHTLQHTIFWADDDQDDLFMFREIVETLAPGHEVVEFSHGQELISTLQQTTAMDLPCLIVLDMNMPVCSGKETLSALKGSPAFRNIPVVMFTTSGSTADQQFCQQLETEMLTKPIDYDHLKNTIEQILNLCGDYAPKQHAA